MKIVPIQKAGEDNPTRPTTLIKLSTKVFLLRADIIPSGIPIIILTNIDKKLIPK